MKIGKRNLKGAAIVAGVLLAGVSAGQAQSNYVTTRCAGGVCQKLVCNTSGACAVLSSQSDPRSFVPIPAYHTLFPKPGEPVQICDFYHEHCHH